MENLVQGVEQARAAFDDDITSAGPTVPTEAELWLLARRGYLGACIQWHAMTYGPRGVLNWIDLMVDAAELVPNPDLLAMREECEQRKTMLDEWRQMHRAR